MYNESGCGVREAARLQMGHAHIALPNLHCDRLRANGTIEYPFVLSLSKHSSARLAEL